MGNKPKAVIADDENSCRLYVKALLTSMGFEVVGEARNGIEAVDLFRKEKPQLMLLDINMPLKTGDEVLEEVIKEAPNTSFIILTAVADIDRVEKCLSLGASNYIRKDTPLAEIRSIIQETWLEFIHKE